jgi:hypothetical protein
MFGYITVNDKALPEAERARYRAHYCALCRALGARYGSAGRAHLSSDMTFLAMLLSSVYDLRETEGSLRCAVNPLRRRSFVETEATLYAADMNAILAYYQCLDDWNDDHNPVALLKSRALAKFLPGIREAHPRQAAGIEGALERLGAMEKSGEVNPDLPANCFGALMGGLFAWREDELAPKLYRLGAALGRFVYLMDAVNDLKADIKRQRYNPLVAMLEADYTPMLTMILSECMAAFEDLPIRRDRNILENHLYAGVWQKYRARGAKGEAFYGSLQGIGRGALRVRGGGHKGVPKAGEAVPPGPEPRRQVRGTKNAGDQRGLRADQVGQDWRRFLRAHRRKLRPEAPAAGGRRPARRRGIPGKRSVRRV